MDGSATFSQDGKYRYELSRVWDYTLPTLYWVCLNPSIADAIKGDHTIKKIITFSQKNGYGRCTVLNLFAYIATHPKDLLMADSMGIDVVGPANDWYLRRAATDIQSSVPTRAGWSHKTGSSVVFAWGATVDALEKSDLYDRSSGVVDMFTTQKSAEGWSDLPKRTYYLTLTNNGHPGHPLRLAYSTPLKEWKEFAEAQ
jgi:hypothetical protein